MPTSNNTDNDTKQRAKAPDSGDVAPAPRVGEPGHPMTPSSFNGRVESDKPTRAQQAIIDERDRRRARKIVDLEEASADAASLDPERAVVIDCREKPPAPKMLIEHLIYRGASHWLAGHVKDGKSIIALWAANEIMENGGHVLWMDWENGTTRLQRWLYELGANPEIVERQFHLYDSPSLGLGGEAIEAQFDAWAERWPDALVVIDSMSKALPSGLSDNSADDVTDWTMGILKPLTRRAFTPIVIDHERKDGSAKDRYGRGSGAKGADADVSLHLEAAEPLSRDSIGKLHLHVRHDRDGYLPAAGWWLEVGAGDGSGHLPVTRIDAPVSKVETAHEQALDVLRLSAEPISKAEIDRRVQAEYADDDPAKLSRATIERAVDELHEADEIAKELGRQGRYFVPAETRSSEPQI